MRTPAVTTKGLPNETYTQFQERVAEDSARVKAKCDALDQFVPRCTSCGETCPPIESGSPCEINNKQMVSRWAQKKAGRDFYQLGNFAYKGWSSSETALAALLDRVRAGEVK